MKSLLKLFFCIISVLLLTACSTVEVKLVQSQKYVMVEVEPKYLQACQVEPPPQKDLYLSAGHDEREDMLTRVLMTQYTNTKLCTADKESIRNLLAKQKADIEAFNAAEDERIKKLGVK